MSQSGDDQTTDVYSEHLWECREKLSEYFGNITKLQNALQNPRKFPDIQLDARQKLGKKRIELLCKYLM